MHISGGTRDWGPPHGEPGQTPVGSWRGVRPADLDAVPQETDGAGIRDAQHPREGKGRSPGTAHRWGPGGAGSHAGGGR